MRGFAIGAAALLLAGPAFAGDLPIRPDPRLTQDVNADDQLSPNVLHSPSTRISGLREETD
jgi:hypothetical protein